MAPIAVYTTVGSADDARRIAQALVERRLVACAQISAIESYYRWDGAVRHEPEYRLLLKTTAPAYAAVEQAIRELHPYELPAIHGLALDRVDPAYAAWIDASVDAPGPSPTAP
jgi:periplasmic divalent cation tolerance protein